MTNPLQQVRDYLADPNRWTRHAIARTASGTPVNSYHPGAVCHCLAGATNKFDAPRTRLEEIVGRSLTSFNDDPATTHADILAVLDEALAP